MHPPIFHYETSRPLHHNGDCSILGVTPDGALYVEEIYAEDCWLAQHAFAADGTLIASVDESNGTNTSVVPLALPDDVIKPQAGWHCMALNYAGARHRGQRLPERVGDLVLPLSIADKVALAQRLKLDLPQLIGIAESYVLAETELIHPNLFLICRRIRFAYALPAPQTDADGEIYDYDTRVIYAAHFFDLLVEEERPTSAMLTDLADDLLHRPMDCLLHGDRLYVADGGADERLSQIHVWRVEWTEKPPTPEETLRKKLYG